MLESAMFATYMGSYWTFWKESLNSDGHQLHQYQQSKQLYLIFNHSFKQWWPINSINIIKTNTEKKPTTYDIGNPGPGFGQAKKCGRGMCLFSFLDLPILF